MSDSKRSLPDIPPRRPVAVDNPTLPALPSSGGMRLFGSRTTVMLRDAKFVDAHTQLLKSKTAQSGQMESLVEARIKLALTLSKLATVPELASHAYHVGRHTRDIENIQKQTENVRARTDLAIALQQLASIEPSAAHAGPSSSSAGLSQSDLEELLQMLPEIANNPELLRTLSMIFAGRLKEKQRT